MPTLGIFAKRPVPGAVKTRLAAAIGADEAARLYEVSLRTLLTRARDLLLRRVIAHVAESEVDLAWFRQFEGYELWPQPSGDLGEKLTAWFDFACATDDRVLVIGSDSPTLPLGYLAQAIAALNHHDCVIGPAHDGGYYLLGLRRPVPGLFEGIEWSGPRVLSQTLERAASQGLRVFQLPTWNDIDQVADLRFLQQQLRSLPNDPVWGPLSTVVNELVAGLSIEDPSGCRDTVANRRAFTSDAE